ncbi:MAG: Fe-Mn family superoxide dismutase [Clostridiales bacterium]|jgi:Fe-Mn family superoxide dismutase|nr:Fe-Mn family superoxide dismutase [Clostridiales bacterium]
MVNTSNFSYATDLASETFFSAHLKLYNGYAESFNKITQKRLTEEDLAEANAAAGRVRDAKRGESYALAGVLLHELYFENIGNSETYPGPAALRLIERDFGGYENFLGKFSAVCLAARGWAVWALNARAGRGEIFLLDAHDDGAVFGSLPLLAADMYEHAYFGDYGSDKAAYVNKFMTRIRWDAVEERVNSLAQ